MVANVRPVFAIDRVNAYLAEVERKNKLRASLPNRGELDDVAHAVNDLELRRSDIGLILARVEVLEAAIRDLIDSHENAYPHGQYEGYDVACMSAAIIRAQQDTGL